MNELANNVVHSDGNNIEQASDPNSTMYNTVLRLTATSAPDHFMQLPMEYQGFCSWTIVHCSGLLLPGNPNVGLLLYRGKYYSFAKPEGMLAFVENPDKYILGVLIEAKKFTPLFHMIRIQDAFPFVNIAKLIEMYGNHPMFRTIMHLEEHSLVSVDSNTETPTHFVESYIDRNYDWNEWSLRRKALQLVFIFLKLIFILGKP